MQKREVIFSLLFLYAKIQLKQVGFYSATEDVWTLLSLYQWGVVHPFQGLFVEWYLGPTRAEGVESRLADAERSVRAGV